MTTTDDTTEVDETVTEDAATETTEGDTEASRSLAGLGGDGGDDDAETFPRSVVEKLRQENGRYRQRAGQADAYAARLHTELVRATGRLADPADLEFDAAHLDNAEALTEAIDALLTDKPHLASRTPRGDIGQGQRGPASGSFSLLDTLKSLA